MLKKLTLFLLVGVGGSEFPLSPTRGGSKAAPTSKMERFIIIVKGFQSLTITTKRSILDVAAGLDLPLLTVGLFEITFEWVGPLT